MREMSTDIMDFIKQVILALMLSVNIYLLFI